MAARVIHFGQDECHRLMVLRSAGYSVEDCASLMQLRAWLATGVTADALVMSDAGGNEPEEAIALARACGALPVILFRTTNLTFEESGVDLIVPCLTPPEIWLNEVESVITKCRTLRSTSEILFEKSAELRSESADAIERSRAERARSKRECARNGRFSGPQRFLPRTGSP